MELFKDIVIHMAYIVMAAGALIAVVSYVRQGYAKRRVAATLLVYQIDCIEESLQSFKQLLAQGNLRNDVIFKTRPFSCAVWDENKHLLLGKLNEADRRTLDNYFNTANFIRDAREILTNMLITNWNAKAMSLSSSLSNHIDVSMSELSEVERKKIDCLDKKYSGLANAFTPALPITILIENISIWKSLYGTTTYDRLKKISYVND